MGALAIRQVVPDTLGAGQDIPGINGPPWAGRPVPIDKRGMSRKPAFRTPVYHRRYIQRGITHGGMFQTRRERAPLVVLPVRSSLAQTINRHVFMNSHYFSWIRPFGMAPGYPVAKVQTLINSSPNRRHARPRPMNNPLRNSRMGVVHMAPSSPGVRNRGYMGSPPRFRKALPVQMVQYDPPVYGQ